MSKHDTDCLRPACSPGATMSDALPESYANVIAMCQAPEGPHEHVPLAPGESPGACFMDCGCKPRVYVALDAIVERLQQDDLATLAACIAAKRIEREFKSA